jgi:hypothetical protein
VFYYWAPVEKRKLFKDLVKNNLKGSGDYGILGLGFYDGQTANKPERNDNLHSAVRLTYPFELENGQIMEVSLQAYTGKFVANTAASGTASYVEFKDERSAASFIYYPQPWGFQAEYSVGRGPLFSEAEGRVIEDTVSGGYIQTMYRLQKGGQSWIPYIREQVFKGGKKHENGVPANDVQEFEAGVEWQANTFMELTTAWSYGDRRTAIAGTVADERGSRLRLQLQFNY